MDFAKPILILLLLCLATLAPAQTKNDADPPQDPTDLVEQVGHPEYAQRKAAEDELRKIGGPALPALLEGKRHVDNEIRMVSSRLIQTIRRDDYRKRIRQFMESDDPENSFGLNGWSFFSEVVGTDIESRRLFVSLHRQETQLLNLLGGKPSRLQLKFGERLSEYQSELTNLETANINTLAALLTIAADPVHNGESESSNVFRINTSQHKKLGIVISNSSVMSQLNAGAIETPMKRLVGEWLKRLPSNNSSLTQVKLFLITRLELKEFLSEAAELSSNQRILVMYRAMAIRFVAIYGDQTHVESLEQLFNDSTEVTSLARPETKQSEERVELRKVEIRDVALAACVRLSNMSFKDFGFTLFEGDDSGFPPINEAGFETDEQRDTAMEKWNSGGSSGN